MRTLYIIGNGFDLMHQMKSSYKDFHQWLIGNSRIDYIAEMQKIFPVFKDGDYLLWSDFEEALGECDIETVAQWSLEDLYITENSISNYVFGSPELIDTLISEIVLNGFAEWAQSIEISRHKAISLNPNSIFLTFNYTDTLEELYAVPENRILHIHGRASIGEPIIVGHQHLIEPSDYLEKGVDFRDNDNIINNMYDYNSLYKPVEKIIEQHSHFFEILGRIKNVIVLGHSCSYIDEPYFLQIRKSVDKDAIWTFSYHNEDDIQRIIMLCHQLNINADKRYLRHI